MDSEFKKCVREITIDSINDVVADVICTKTPEEQSEEELDQELDNYLQHLRKMDNSELDATNDSLPALPSWMLGLDKKGVNTKKRRMEEDSPSM